MRHSAQRDLILNVVQNSCDHPSAETIYERAKVTMPNLSLGTVYRNLHQLAEMERIREIPIVDGSDRFDKTVVAHSHFRCLECNAVFDVDATSIDSLNRKVEDETGNKVEFSELLFVGVCKNCLSNKE